MLQGISLDLPAGCLAMVVGPVGCGKSALLAALLGELHSSGAEPYLAGSAAYTCSGARHDVRRMQLAAQDLCLRAVVERALLTAVPREHCTCSALTPARTVQVHAASRSCWPGFPPMRCLDQQQALCRQEW